MSVLLSVITTFLICKAIGQVVLINQQIQSENVDNPCAVLPAVCVDDMVTLMRIDKTIGTERIAQYVLNAYDVINGVLPRQMLLADYLAGFESYQQDFWRRAYKRAVMHEAAAQFIDAHPDYDTTGTGVIRSDNESSKSDKFRRVCQHAIADMTGKPRNRIRLL